MRGREENSGKLTEGPITKKIVWFAIPLFLSSLIQQMYNTVDLVFIGQILNKEATAAVGASSLLINLMIGFFNGIGVGVGILTAKAYGCGDHRKMKDVIHNAAGLALAGSLILMLFGWIFSPAILRLMHTPEAILELASVYLRFYFISMVSVICFNTASGILRALGNSRSPMLYQFYGGIANVFGDFIFLYFLKLGVRGAAFATLFSQTCACIFTVRHLFKLHPDYALKVRQICIKRKVTGEILSIGLPSGIQAMIITLSNLIVQSQINTLGVEAIAAFTAYFRVETFVYNPILAFGQAASTFVGQNIGAGKLKRTREGIRAAIRIGVLVTVVISLLMIVFSGFFFGLFTKDAAVIAIGSRMARVSFPLYFLYVFLEVFASSTRGAGKALPPMLITILNMCLVRTVILLTIMHFSPSPEHLTAVYPLTWAVTAACHFAYYRSGRWIPKPLREQEKV